MQVGVLKVRVRSQSRVLKLTEPPIMPSETMVTTSLLLTFHCSPATRFHSAPKTPFSPPCTTSPSLALSFRKLGLPFLPLLLSSFLSHHFSNSASTEIGADESRLSISSPLDSLIVLCVSVALSFSLFVTDVVPASAFVVTTLQKLPSDELATVRLFEENSPSVVYITNLAVRELRREISSAVTGPQFRMSYRLMQPSTQEIAVFTGVFFIATLYSELRREISSAVTGPQFRMSYRLMQPSTQEIAVFHFWIAQEI